MPTGAITQYIDVAQLTLYAFWIFFAGLIYYLHQENKREGYPLESERSGHVTVQGYPPVPAPKTYLIRDGSTVLVPSPLRDDHRPLQAVPREKHLGAGIEPIGDPMLAGVGPGSWAQRADVPDRTFDNAPRIVPLRVATGFGIDPKDVDPRGLPVVGTDDFIGGTVVDAWVDRADNMLRYLEVRVAEQARTVLLPINFCRIRARGVTVDSVCGHHFAMVPITRHPELVTLLEEEKIMAFYGAGTLYATPSRAEPLL